MAHSCQPYGFKVQTAINYAMFHSIIIQTAVQQQQLVY